MGSYPNREHHLLA